MYKHIVINIDSPDHTGQSLAKNICLEDEIDTAAANKKNSFAVQSVYRNSLYFCAKYFCDKNFSC